MIQQLPEKLEKMVQMTQNYNQSLFFFFMFSTVPDHNSITDGQWRTRKGSGAGIAAFAVLRCLYNVKTGCFFFRKKLRKNYFESKVSKKKHKYIYNEKRKTGIEQNFYLFIT